MNDVSTDVGILVVRLTLGLMLAVHGLNKILGDGGIRSAGRWFQALGLRPGTVYAAIAAATELGAGILMVLGLLQPLSSAAFVGLMTVAAFTDHRGKGFFVFRGGWEYVAVVGLVAVSLAVTGPGRWSLDAAFGWSLHGVYWAIVAAVVGLVSAAGPIAMSGRVRTA